MSQDKENKIVRPANIEEDMEAVNAMEADIELDNFVNNYKNRNLPPQVLKYLDDVAEKYGLKLIEDEE